MAVYGCVEPQDRGVWVEGLWFDWKGRGSGNNHCTCTVSNEVEMGCLQDDKGEGCMGAFSPCISNRNKQGSLFNLLPC